MTKQEILDKFSDIDFVYNDSSKHDTLSRMLDELLKEQEAVKPIHKCWNGRFTQLNRINGYSFCPYCGKPIDWGKMYYCKNSEEGRVNE